MIRWLIIALAIFAALQSAHARTIQMEHISAEVTGEGPAVILVPGLSSPRAVWDGVAPELAKTHRVYLVQVNGFGGEDPRANLKPGILAGVVADLHALIAAEKLERPALIGHSLGGLAGLMLARDHPADLGRLMVVDALPFIGVLFATDATVAGIEPQAAAMRGQMVAGHGRPLPDAVAQMIAGTNAIKPASRARIAEWVKAADLRVSGQALYEDLQADLRGDMAAIRTPITLLYPWSAMTPKERADSLYRGAYAAAPAVTFVPVEDSGHFIMLDQPEAFRVALADFLK
jgi:pimeloyl-ACP methyl ester carboxylesterase